MFFNKLKSYEYGVQQFVCVTVLFILMSIILITIKVFNINIHRYDPHDPKVIIFEILPIIILTIISFIIGLIIFSKIKNKKYVIAIFFLSQAVFGMTFTIFYEEKSLKTYIITISIIIFVSLIQYLLIKIIQKSGFYSINYPEEDNGGNNEV